MAYQKQPWVVFKFRGKEIAAYTVKGTFSSELRATRELLAQERNCSIEEILPYIVVR